MKKILLTFLIILILSLAALAAVFLLRPKVPVTPAKLPAAAQPAPVVSFPFLFLRDGKIQKYDAGTVTQAVPQDDISDFVYNRNSKTLYYLRQGEIWTQLLNSATPSALTQTSNKTTAFFLSPDAKEIAYLTRDITSTATTSATPIPTLTLLNIGSGTKTSVSNPDYDIYTVTWEPDGNLEARRLQINPANHLLFETVIYNQQLKALPRTIPGLISESWSPDQSLQAVAASESGQTTLALFNQKGERLNTTKVTGFFRQFAWSPDSHYVIAALTGRLLWTSPEKAAPWQGKNLTINRLRFIDNQHAILESNESVFLFSLPESQLKKVLDNASNPWAL